MTVSRRESMFLPIFVFLLASLFYLYEFILQVSPSVMTHDLMRDLNLDAAALGITAAFYFYAYAPMQVPAGLLYDRFGPRAMISIAILICALGSLLFSMTTDEVLASAGRFFMGIGSAFSFIGILVLVSHWFKPQYFALLVGIAQLMSSVGAMIGQMPLAILVDKFGWRHSMVGLAVVGVVLALLTWLFIRDYPPNYCQKKHRLAETDKWKKLKAVAHNAQTWYVAGYAFLVWAPVAVFAALWGVPYLMARYAIPAASAAGIVSLIWLAIGLACPAFGWLSDHLQRRCLPMGICAVCGMIALTVVLFVDNLPMWLLIIMMFFFGAGAAGQTVSFGVVRDNNKSTNLGAASGLNNMATVAGGALLQPLVGVILTWTWTGKTVGGVPDYGVVGYQKGLFILPLCYLAAWVLSTFFIKETHCKLKYPHQNAAALGH